MAQVTHVRVTDRGYEPREVRIEPGGVVRFEVIGTTAHILTGPGLSASPLLRPGAVFEFAFSEPGELGDEVLLLRGAITFGEPPAHDADGPDETPPSEQAAAPDQHSGAPAESGGDPSVPAMTAAALATVAEPGPRAGRWSGISWEVVQSRYRQLKAQFAGDDDDDDDDDVGAPHLGAGACVCAPDEGAEAGAAATGLASGMRAGRLRRPSSSARRRPLATEPHSLTYSSSEDDEDEADADGRGSRFADARRRLKLESERRVLASRGRQSPSSSPSSSTSLFFSSTPAGVAAAASAEAAAAASSEQPLPQRPLSVEAETRAAAAVAAHAHACAAAAFDLSPPRRLARPPPSPAACGPMMAPMTAPLPTWTGSPPVAARTASLHEATAREVSIASAAAGHAECRDFARRSGVRATPDVQRADVQTADVPRALAMISPASPAAPSSHHHKDPERPAPPSLAGTPIMAPPSLAGSCSHGCLQLRRSAPSSLRAITSIGLSDAPHECWGSSGGDAALAALRAAGAGTTALVEAAAALVAPRPPPVPLPPKPYEVANSTTAAALASAGWSATVLVAEVRSLGALSRTMSSPALGAVPVTAPRLAASPSRPMAQPKGGGTRRSVVAGTGVEYGRKLPPLVAMGGLRDAAAAWAVHDAAASQPPTRSSVVYGAVT